MSVFATLGSDGSYQLTQAGYLLIIAIIIGAMLLVCLIRRPDEKGTLGTRKLVFSAMAIALATVASMIKLLIDIIFIRTIGLYAAAISTLASYAVMLYLRLTRLKGYFDVKKDLLNILSGSAALVIGAVVMANVKHFIPQCLFLFLSLIIFFAMNRKVMGNIVGKLKGR